jgi:hypothetical protein
MLFFFSRSRKRLVRLCIKIEIVDTGCSNCAWALHDLQLRLSPPKAEDVYCITPANKQSRPLVSACTQRSTSFLSVASICGTGVFAPPEASCVPLFSKHHAFHPFSLGGCLNPLILEELESTYWIRLFCLEFDIPQLFQAHK